MDRARRIADQGEAAIGVAGRLDHRQRIVPARAGQLERAVTVAEAVGELGHELPVVERDQLAREPIVRRPHDRRAPAEHGQQRERAGGEEPLERTPVMRLAVPDGSDDPGLRVVPAHHADAGEVAQRRRPAVGGGEQTGAGASAARQPHLHRLRPALDPRRLVGCGDLERTAGQLRHAAQQRPPDHPVLDNVAERLAADRAMIVMHRERRMPLADLDVQNWLGLACQVNPDADAFEQTARAAADRGHPAIERRLCGGGQRPLLDQQDPDAGAGQRARQRQAGHAAARDQHIETGCAVRHRTTVPQPRWRLQGA